MNTVHDRKILIFSIDQNQRISKNVLVFRAIISISFVHWKNSANEIEKRTRKKD